MPPAARVRRLGPVPSAYALGYIMPPATRVFAKDAPLLSRKELITYFAVQQLSVAPAPAQRRACASSASRLRQLGALLALRSEIPLAPILSVPH